MRIVPDFSTSVIRRSAMILTKKERQKIGLVILFQVFLSILDLIGVAIIGILGALAITGVGSQKPGNRVSSALRILQIQNLDLQSQATVLGILAASLLIFKTIISVVFVRKTTFFLSRRGASISSNLVSKLLSLPLTKLQEKSIQETQYALTSGVDTITLGILNVTAIMIADISLLVILAAGLFIVDPTIALSAATIFGLAAFALYRLMSVKSRNLGIAQAELTIKTNESIAEVISSYRELIVRNRRSYYARKIGDLRLKNANAVAERAFMPNTSKYVIEVTMVIGSLLIGAAQFLMNDAAHAIAVLSVFLAASTRISPAVLRLQQGAITVKGNIGAAHPTLELIESLHLINPVENLNDLVITKHPGFVPRIQLVNVSMRYPDKTKYAVKNVNLEFAAGSVVAVVGPSGAGKTTLIDLILGVLEPDSGNVFIGTEPPLKAISRWPGGIGYVPQDVVIKNGTIRENVCMGYPIETGIDELVWEALEISQLRSLVESMPNGLDSHVGDRGTRISGGQRQRLGIARAMFTHPNLLVLDEATSALDGETELNISDAIHALKGNVTVVMIAHRLSTVREADSIIYMQEGKVISQGTFQEVRNAVPDFDYQAQLMGL